MTVREGERGNISREGKREKGKGAGWDTCALCGNERAREEEKGTGRKRKRGREGLGRERQRGREEDREREAERERWRERKTGRYAEQETCIGVETVKIA